MSLIEQRAEEIVSRLLKELKRGRLTISDEDSLTYIDKHRYQGEYFVKEINRFCVIGSILDDDVIELVYETDNSSPLPVLLERGYIKLMGGITGRLGRFLAAIQEDYDNIVISDHCEPKDKLKEFAEILQYNLELYDYAHYLDN